MAAKKTTPKAAPKKPFPGAAPPFTKKNAPAKGKKGGGK